MIDINSLREREKNDALTVSELNNYIKNLFESNRTLSSITVRGEISNFTNHRSGHLYFSLKDSDGQIRAVMFRSRASALKFVPESGMKVIVHGSVTVYPRDGSYQLYVSTMQPDGIGALYLAYEQMKARLAEEGLFDEIYKKQIPLFPKRVGVITSPTGAAVRDIINVSGRRYPCADIFIYPALVQGDGAEESLIKALDYLDRSKLCDVIIIGRGGGSIEDLWAFNSELLARRIFASEVPVISAVGHETDFTICDFVADLRAPTPSAAAELAVPDIREILLRLDSIDERLCAALTRSVTRARERLERLEEKADSVVMFKLIEEKRQAVKLGYEKAKLLTVNSIEKVRERLSNNVAKANAMNPLSVIYRGYSLAESPNGIIKSINDIKIGDCFTLTVSNGKIIATATDLIKGD